MIIKPIKNKKEANKTKPRRCWRCCMAQTTELQTELQVGTSSHLDSGDENSSSNYRSYTDFYKFCSSIYKCSRKKNTEKLCFYG